jgi:hypothetical protein
MSTQTVAIPQPINADPGFSIPPQSSQSVWSASPTTTLPPKNAAVFVMTAH